MDDFSTSPSPRLIGGTMRHTGNGKIYIILGYVWLGETDRWGYLHRARGEMGPMIARPMSHLEGTRSDGSPRYDTKSWEPPNYAFGLSTEDVIKEAEELVEELSGWIGPEYSTDIEIAAQRSHGLLSTLIERLRRK